MILADWSWVLDEGEQYPEAVKFTKGNGEEGEGGVEELFHFVEFCKCCMISSNSFCAVMVRSYGNEMGT